jgi:hypothetical protein
MEIKPNGTSLAVRTAHRAPFLRYAFIEAGDGNSGKPSPNIRLQ